MRPVTRYVARSVVCLSVYVSACLSVGHTGVLIHAKSDEPIEMPIRGQTHVHGERTMIWGYIGATWQIQLIDLCAAAMGPYIKLL